MVQNEQNPTENSTPHFIVTVQGELHGVDTPANREIARRIHACVNACEGIDTEELERGIIRDMQQVISQVIPLLKSRQIIPGNETEPVSKVETGAVESERQAA